jgi:hypothetical protein
METINKTDNTAGNSPMEINMQTLNFLKTASKYVILSLTVGGLAGPAYAEDSINKNPNWTYIPYVPKGGEAAKTAPEAGAKTKPAETSKTTPPVPVKPQSTAPQGGDAASQQTAPESGAKTKPAETSKTTPPVPVKPQSAAPQGGDATAQETAPESAAKPADTSKSTQAVPVNPQPGPSQGGASEARQTAPESGAKSAVAPVQPESKTGPKSTSEASTKKDTETKKSSSAEVVKPQGKESAASEGSGTRNPDKSYAGKDTGQPTKSPEAGAITGNAVQSQEELPFEVADKNADHFVSKEELKDYPHLLEVFDKVDAGKDGKLEQHEYANLISEKKREGFQP